jgi:transketolase
MQFNDKQLKSRIVKAAFDAKEGHIPSALSILDIVWVLYNKVMNLSHKNSTENDRFILSKGHASLAIYVVLEELKIIPKSYLDSFCNYESPLGGHPDCNKVPAIEASTGSLGHGMPIALGIALASKIKKFNNRVYCIIGDGECNEGTIWESAMLASHHNLRNFTCIVDYNHSTDRALYLGDIKKKFESFGWNSEVIDGHDHEKLQSSLSQTTDSPRAIVCETIKGYGIKRMENEPAWHHKCPSEEELNEILDELS